MAKYYISPFNFFYAKNEKLGDKFAKSSFDGTFSSETESYNLTTVLAMIAKGYEENETEFVNAYIDISDLISGVLKREFIMDIEIDE